MRRSIASVVLLVVVLLAPALPVGAGGFATVRLDEPLAEAVVEVPWNVGFMVKQHDVSPTNDVTPRLDARHRETGEAISAVGRQQGAVGHFVAEVVFPFAGEWKWGITPDPFPGTSFETLTVLSAPGAAPPAPTDADAPHPANIHSGTCDALGDPAFPLSDVGPGVTIDGAPTGDGMMGEAGAVPVAVSVTTIDASLDELIAGGYAINVQQGDAETGTDVACGDLGGRMVGEDFVVGLQPRNGSGDVGVAMLREDGGQTTVTLSMVTVAGASPAAAGGSAAAAAVEIVGGGGQDWGFDPPRVEIPVGGSVNWTNATGEPHTVTGRDLTFDDSSLLDEGDSFSQTFDTPGTYAYFCAPHPWMLGTVVVK